MWEFGERKFELSSLEPPCRRSRQRSSPFMRRHLLRPEPVTPSTAHALSPSPWHHSWARNNVVLLEPATLCTRRRSQSHDAVHPRHPRAHNVIVLPEPMTSSSPWHPRARDIVEPTPPLSPQHHRPPQARKATLYTFLYYFGPTNPDFDMLHCHIALICYIAFVLLHCFDVIHWHIALICYIAFNISHCFDMLHCL
jgi:hypothetical protein